MSGFITADVVLSAGLATTNVDKQRSTRGRRTVTRGKRQRERAKKRRKEQKGEGDIVKTGNRTYQLIRGKIKRWRT